MKPPHGLWGFSRLVSSCSCSDLVRYPTERAESQVRSETNTFLLPLKTSCTFWLYCKRDNSHRAHGCWCLHTPSPVTCFPLKTAWRGISMPMPASLSESCLPEPCSVSRGGRVSTRNRCGLFFADDHGACGALCLRSLRLCASHYERASV